MSNVQPVQHGKFATRDREQAYEFIRRTYVEHQPPKFGCDREDSGMRQVSAQISGLHTSTAHLGMGYECTTDPIDYLLAYGVFKGRVAVRANGEETVARPDAPCLYPIGSPITVSARNPYMGLAIMPLAPVEEMAAASLGESTPLRFDSMAPVSATMGRYWMRMVQFVHRELMNPGSAADNPLVARQLATMMAQSLLSVFPNSTMTQAYVPGPGNVAPAALRRAAAYIDANADRPVRLAQIAEVAGVTARALQYGFARHYETTPMGYLRRVRLARAHRQLQTADVARGDTVAAIAARWGFGSPSRFAAGYQEMYGQPPARTLRT